MNEYNFENSEKKEVINKELENDINSLTREINLLKNDLEEKESRLFGLRKVLLELLEINKIKNVKNENGNFFVSKRKSLMKFNLKRNFQEQSDEFKKELLEKGLIKEWYHLNLDSNLLENEEVVSKISKFINYFASDKYLYHKTKDTSFELTKDDYSLEDSENYNINLGICTESKILVSSCNEDCCVDKDETEFCLGCEEEFEIGDEGSFINDNFYCDNCGQTIEEEAAESQNEILNDLYDLGVEMLNVDEMDISDYEKGFDY